MQLRLHNTLTRTKEAFEPIDPSRVRLYVCGPTVYQRIHVGNARAFVVFDVLYRLLKYLYPGENRVTYVRNITDIDDKIIDQARANDESIRGLTERTTAQFHEDLAALGCLEPDEEPRATDHVPEMITLIEKLIERGHAYVAEGHVLFSVPSMPSYGRLSGRNREEQIAGARVDVAPYKRDPADFVLWKPSTDDQPAWESPWGRGRPGWHIECSAMSERYLGPLPFDIHAGGLDLIFPHHENEIAQSCCAHGLDLMARYWLHNGFVDMRGEKMSKTLGNIVRAHQALEMADDAPVRRAEIIRMWMLGTHYRQPIEFNLNSIKQARSILDRLYDALYHGVNRDREVDDIVHGRDVLVPANNAPFRHVDELTVEALCEDLNTPEVIRRLSQLADECFRCQDEQARQQKADDLIASAQLLGLLRERPSVWRRGGHHLLQASGGYSFSGGEAGSRISGEVSEFSGEITNSAAIETLVAERQEARRIRDFARADAIRLQLSRQGIMLEDRPDGTTDWRRA